jgi:signal transduction histidine kinase
VAADSAVGRGDTERSADPDAKFAVLIRASVAEIMASFVRRFDDSLGFVVDDHDFRAEMMATAAQIIEDVERSVNAAEVRVDDEQRADAWAMVRTGRDSFLSPADGLSAAVIFFNVAFASFIGIIGDDLELLPSFKIAVDALNESISRRMQAVAGACAASLVERGQLARSEERQRIARELHDRVGEALSVGLRRLDLQEETWAAPAVLDEVFLIIREALRNALRHGAPQLVLIGVEVTMDELRAWVLDDGRGFVSASAMGGAPGGTGIASMHERAALIDGRLALLSMPGHGTRVELCVPLPGRGK